MTAPMHQILGWEDYPEPRVVTVRGTLVVEVSIPRAIRHLFGSGSGKTNNRRLSTGTTDPALARRKMWPLAHSIYKQFDQMQADAANTHDHQTDNFALDTISALASSFNYNRGVPPELSNKTPYAELKKLKDTLDSYTVMMIDQGPPPEEAIAASTIGAHAIRERSNPAQAKAQMLDKLANSGPFTMKQNALLAKNATSVIQTYWQDLSTTAAREQGVSEPSFDDNGSIDVTEHEGTYLPQGVIETPTVIERKRRVKTNDTIRISDIRYEYFVFLEQKYEKANTRRKWSRAVQSFPRPDATTSSGYDGKIRFATDGKMQMHLATKDLTVAFKNGEVINPIERGHIAFRTDDIVAFMALLDSKSIPYSDYGTAFAKEWHQVFFHDTEGNVIEVHQSVG